MEQEEMKAREDAGTRKEGIARPAEEDNDGLIVLSKDRADKIKVWDTVSRAYEKGVPVEGRVVEVVKGGLAVDVGVRAFLPGSPADLRPVKNPASLLGQT